jgi:CheY-like chemotaxis protein
MVMQHHKLPLDVVGDAETAVEYLRTNSPDLVVMDIFLPGIDGYQALKQIRTTARNPQCRVIATTAYYTNDTQNEVAQRGFDGYLPKPFDSNTLVDYLRSVVEG